MQNQRINGLQEELEACRTKVVPVETVVKTARITLNLSLLSDKVNRQLTLHNFLMWNV